MQPQRIGWDLASIRNSEREETIAHGSHRKYLWCHICPGVAATSIMTEAGGKQCGNHAKGAKDVVGWAHSNHLRWRRIFVEVGAVGCWSGHQEAWALSTMLSQVDLASADELQVEQQKRSETSRVDSFHDAPGRSSTPWISPHALFTLRPFENPNISLQLLSWKDT